jgi:DNA-binding NtrC family response regulator
MKTKKIKVLIIEDSEDDLKLLLRELNKSSYKIIHKLVEDAKGLESALQEDWDVIISDYSLPGFSGPEALKMCNEKGIDIPLIL